MPGHSWSNRSWGDSGALIWPGDSWSNGPWGQSGAVICLWGSLFQEFPKPSALTYKKKRDHSWALGLGKCPWMWGSGQCWAGVTNIPGHLLSITRPSGSDPLRVSSWVIPRMKIELSVLTCVRTGCENQFFKKSTKNLRTG
jgi:hypothetical protein